MFASQENLSVIKFTNDFNEFKTSGRRNVIRATKTRMTTVLQKYLDE